ncbi:MAG: septal ring lytic transglycosylase RlpA family protein [Alphaproteobacteria bacterium]|nr:septal ring lytic transglycosylase RlpA family protein [Alphaproteobacteria bacterium]
MMRKITSILFVMLAVGFLGACSETRYAAHVVKQIPLPGEQSRSKTQGSFKVGSAYTIKGKRYYPSEAYNHSETGTASWYGPGFHGKKTANGEIFDKNELTAAHRTLQMPSIVRVTNLGNGRSVILRVNDRGPFAHNRILDVSERAAVLLGFKNSGTAKIKLEVMGSESKQVAALAKQGRDTRGYEVALNRQPRVPSIKPASITREPVTQVVVSMPTQKPAAPLQSQTPVPLAKPLPVEAEPLSVANVSAPTTTTATNPYGVSHLENVAPRNVIASSNISNVAQKQIFVQAGSFSQEANALLLSDQLSDIGPSKVYLTKVNNRPYFRVRLGPYDDHGEARRILASLNNSGNKNAVLIFD